MSWWFRQSKRFRHPRLKTPPHRTAAMWYGTTTNNIYFSVLRIICHAQNRKVTMKDKILVVDDLELNRELLSDILTEDYDILMAEDGVQAIQMLDALQNEISIVLLDLQMPNLDGFGVLAAMREHHLLEHIPVLVITGEQSTVIESECFQLGVSDFIHKPFEPSLVRMRVKNIVDLFTYKKSLEDKVAMQTKTLREQYHLLEVQATKLKETNIRIIDILGMVVEFRNLESGEHIKRVKGFTEILAKQFMKDYPEYGLTDHTIEMIVSSSSLHDVGKIAIPDNILLKPGRLTNEEFECMKSHTVKGCEVLNSIEGVWEDEYQKYAYEICRHHHERFDGRGYPDGLKGDDIPISAQLVSVADVYDALVSERCYKKAFEKPQAAQMIINGECGVFSPKILDSFSKVTTQFAALADENKNQAVQ